MKSVKGDYYQRATAFFESYFEVPASYYEKGTARLKTEAIRDLMEQLIEQQVFVDEKDIRREALLDYDVVLPTL